MRDNRILIVGIIVSVLIAGVVVIFLGGGDTSGEQEIISVSNVSSSEGSASGVKQPTSEMAVSASSTAQSEQLIPTPRSGFEATDPSTVNLVSGDVQFIEAFAFW